MAYAYSVETILSWAYSVSAVKLKDTKQIIRDSERRPKLSKLGMVMFIIGMLLLFMVTWLANHSVYVGGTPVTDMVLFLGGGVLAIGWILLLFGGGCPICDSGLNKKGICSGCGRNPLERHFHIEDLKQRGASEQYRRFNPPGDTQQIVEPERRKPVSHQP